jgi:hypothetical protein
MMSMHVSDPDQTPNMATAAPAPAPAHDDTHSYAISRLHAVCRMNRWMRPIFDVNAQQQQQQHGNAAIVSYTARVRVNGVWYDGGVDAKRTQSAARVEAAVAALRVLDSVVVG